MAGGSIGIRSDAGYPLDLVHSEGPVDFKPMPDVGSAVMEIRLHGDNEFRVFDVALRGSRVRVTLLRQEDSDDAKGFALLESRRVRI